MKKGDKNMKEDGFEIAVFKITICKEDEQRFLNLLKEAEEERLLLKPFNTEWLEEEVRGDDEEELYLPEIHKDFCLKEHLIQVEEALLQKALDMADGKKAQAARLLGITPQNFSAKWNKMRDRKEIRNEENKTEKT